MLANLSCADSLSAERKNKTLKKGGRIAVPFFKKVVSPRDYRFKEANVFSNAFPRKFFLMMIPSPSIRNVAGMLFTP
ncbi:MAG: Uncharacterised protein [Cryomorphaceae bacterium]|nr:MAG: Uncharacterised protein [Cryomorphaceae bacterium]